MGIIINGLSTNVHITTGGPHPVEIFGRFDGFLAKRHGNLGDWVRIGGFISHLTSFNHERLGIYFVMIYLDI